MLRNDSVSLRCGIGSSGTGTPRKLQSGSQPFLGHADAKTTQIYAHYAPSEQEVAMVNAAFSADIATGSNPGSKLSEPESTPTLSNPRS
jgi:hypothetical protein